MRWYWFDRYTEFVSGDRATGIKVVSLAEEHLHDHFPGYPVMPNTLISEGIAQTAGVLISEHYDFQHRVILAKFGRLEFFDYALPGDTLTYDVQIRQITAEGASVVASSKLDQRLQAEAELFFVHLSNRSSQRPLFDPGAFANWIRTLGVYDVGVDADGLPLAPPPQLTELLDGVEIPPTMAN